MQYTEPLNPRAQNSGAPKCNLKVKIKRYKGRKEGWRVAAGLWLAGGCRLGKAQLTDKPARVLCSLSHQLLLWTLEKPGEANKRLTCNYVRKQCHKITQNLIHWEERTSFKPIPFKFLRDLPQGPSTLMELPYPWPADWPRRLCQAQEQTLSSVTGLQSAISWPCDEASDWAKLTAPHHPAPFIYPLTIV